MAIVGNIITLLIVGAVLFLYRQFDKRNRSLDKVHRYAEHLKDELDSFVSEKENAVKDYSIDLDVQQKSAKELMNKLKLTEEEFAEKAKAISKIDERINDYDSSLEELVRMTSMVQGNLDRIREESAFVETVNKKVSDVRERIGTLEKGLAGLKQHFEQGNAASLSELSNYMLAEVKDSIAALKSEAETIQRNVREQRDSIEKTEQMRSASLAKDMEAINRTLKEVTGRANASADKMEEAVLARLKAQADERIQRLQNSIEENLKKHQENARQQVVELDTIAAKQREIWNAGSGELENKRRLFQEEWARNVEELTTLIKTQQTEWLTSADEKEAKSKQVLSELERAAANIRAYIVEQNDALERKLKETQSHMDESITVLEGRLANASREAEQKVLESADERLGNWKQLALDADANLQKMLLGLETSSQQIKDLFEKEVSVLEQRLKDTKNQTEGDISLLKQQISDAVKEAEAKATEEAGANLEQIIRSFEDMEKRLADMQTHTNEAVSQMEERLRETAAAAEKRVLESADIHLEDWKQVAVDTDAKLKNLLHELETSSEAAQAELDAETEHIRQQLSETSAHTDQAIANLENSIVRTAAAVDAKIAGEADAKLVKWLHESENQDTKAKQILEELEEITAQAKAHFASEIEALNKQLEEEHARTKDLIAELQDKFAVETAALDDKLNGADAHTSEAILALDKRINAVNGDFDLSATVLKKDIAKAVQNVKADIAAELDAVKEQSRQRIAEFDASFAGTKTRLTEEIAETEERLQSLHTHFDETVNRIEAAVNTAVTNTDIKAENAAHDRLAQWKTAFEAGDAQTERRLAELEDLFSQAKSNVITDLERADEQTKQRIADLEAVFAQAKDTISADLERSDELNRQHVTKLEALWTRTKSDISAEFDLAGEQNQQRIAGLEASFSEAKKRIANEIAETEAHLQSIENRVDETVERIEAAVSTAVENTDVKAENAANDRLARWKAAFEAGDEQSSQRVAELEALLTRTRGDISAELDLAGEQNKRRIAELEALYAQTKDGIADKLENTGEQTKERIAGLEDLFSKAKSGISAEIDIADEENQKRIADFEASFAKTKVRIEAEAAGIEAGLQSIHDEFDETVKRIEHVVGAAVANADTKAEIAGNDRLALWKTAFEEGDEQTKRRIEELDALLSQTRNDISAEQTFAGEQNKHRIVELEASFANAKSHLEETIENAESQMRSIQREIDDTALHIKTTISASIEDVELRTQTAAEVANADTKRVLFDLEAAISRSKSRFAEEIEQAENHLRGIHEQMSETSGNIEAGMKNAIEEANAKAKEKTVEIEQKFKEMEINADAMIQSLEDQFQKAAEDMEQSVLLETDAKFEEYRKVQAEQFQRFELLSEDTAQLENELRDLLQDTETRISTDFSAFQKSSKDERETALASFITASESLRAEMVNIKNELAALKELAYENVSEKLKVFEDDFSADIAKRNDEIDRRLTEWRQFLDNQLASIAEDAEFKRKTIENAYTGKLETGLNEHNEQLTAQLEKLKLDADNFEEGIRTQMKIADEALFSLKEQFRQDMEDARTSAEASVRSEIGRHNLALADTLKQNQREIETKLKKIQDDIDGRSGEISGLFESSKGDIDEWKQGLNTQLRDLETALEETRKRNRDLVTESNERLSNVRASIEDVRTEADAHRAELFSRIEEQARSLDVVIKEAERHIKEFSTQTNLFERADTLKQELERHIEDLKDELDHLDQRRTETADLENQFVKIKRLEDEVNAKMTRFLSEKHRIEQMETEFNRLLQTSKAVDEKLAQLSASDDTLQAMQVEIRKFNDALESSEERYQRIERKNQTLDATNEGIDRNFKALQESEQAAARINAELLELSAQITSFRSTIGVLAAESEKAKSAADKIKTLDTTLVSIDERIVSAQASREWLARLETRLEELNKQAQEQVKLMGTLMKDTGISKDKGAPSVGVRENVIKLAHQGWTVDEIARSLKLGRGEVELILEISQKG
jgi:chromosome segregation ATPase